MQSSHGETAINNLRWTSVTHIKLLIQKAREENITILNLLPHVTDKMQPLDVSCFGPLKRAWIELLNERINVLGPNESISKSTFVDLILKYGIRVFQ